METTSVAQLVNRLSACEQQCRHALAACRSIRFANNQAVRHGGEYSLNDLLAADRLAKEALQMGPIMTEEYVDRSARAIVKKHRAQQRGKKGGGR